MRQISSAGLAQVERQLSVRLACQPCNTAHTAVLSEARVLAEAARIALSDPGALFDADSALLPIQKMPPEARVAIASIEVEHRTQGRGKDAECYTVTRLKFWDKNAAIEKLMKHLGMFERDNRQPTGIFDKVPLEIVQQILERLRDLAERDRLCPATRN